MYGGSGFGRSTRLGQRAARRFARHGADLDALKARILRHTGQIPLFIEEVARQLIDRGPRGRCRPVCRQVILGHARNSSHGSGRDRVAHRSLAERRQGASATRFGSRTADIAALLAAVTEMPVAQLQSRLWSLEILDFLEEARSVPSVEYVFAHDLIREVAYEFDPPLAAGSAAPPDFDGSGNDLGRAGGRRCGSALPSFGQGAGLGEGRSLWPLGREEGVCQIGVPGRHGIFQDRHGCGGQAAGIDGA